MPRPAIFVQLAEEIRREISPYPDAQAIPSVRDLARRYEVAFDTVRKAMALLADQHEVVCAGPGRPYQRQRQGLHETFCKPYPMVGVVSLITMSLQDDDYMSKLISSFISALIARVSVNIAPIGRRMEILPIPGGATVGPPHVKCSAVALRSGAPNDLLTALLKTGTIVMTLDSLTDLDGVDSVAVDCDAEAETALAYLHRLGHRHIAFLAPRFPQPPTHWANGIDPDSSRFSRALMHAKRRAGLPDVPQHYMICDLGYGKTDVTVGVAMDRLWKLRPAPSALICFTTVVAAHALAVLQRRGLRCPRDVSIVARGEKTYQPVAYTTLASDPQRIGTSAAAHLLARLTDPNAMATRLLFQSTLVEGATACPAPGRTP